MAGTPRLVALLAIGLTSHACTQVCDEAGLRRAAREFEAGQDLRAAGLEALAAACPTLPPALAQGLADGETSAQSSEDPAWRALLARVCPAATQASGAALHDELDGIRTDCDLDRLGLLATDDVFAREDLFVHALFEWLLAGRVDGRLAATVARPLLTAHTFAVQGLAPPRGTADIPLRDHTTEVRITPTTLFVDGVAVLSLERGRLAVDAVHGRVLPAVHAALAGPVARAKQKAEDSGVPWDGGMTLLVDRTVPFVTLASVLHTSIPLDFSEYQLVVHDGRELRGMPFIWPQLWSPYPLEESRSNRDCDLTFIVHTDAVLAHLGSRKTTREFPSPAGAEIGRFVDGIKSMYPAEVVATFNVADEIPLQTLVSLIDTVRGDGCRLAGAVRGEQIPGECRFWQMILDSEPRFIDPIHLR